jgi:hypothetical protein
LIGGNFGNPTAKGATVGRQKARGFPKAHEATIVFFQDKPALRRQKKSISPGFDGFRRKESASARLIVKHSNYNHLDTSASQRSFFCK